MERWWNDIDTVKLKFSEKKPVPMPLNPPQISCGLAWDRTRACAGTTTHTDLYYEGRLISNAHSEIFCRRSKVAMLAQCVLVATTLLHSGAKFHSFLYNGSKTVRFNMESCYGGMSTRLKRRAVTEFLSAENVTPAEINRRSQPVYGEDTTVNRTRVNCWPIKFRECEPGRSVCRQDSFDSFFGTHKEFT